VNEAAPSTVSAAPPTQLSHREVLVVFSGLMLGMLLASLDQTIVSTALPTIVGEFGGLQHLSWVITAYLLTSTASVPLYGKLSDLYGRKLLFQVAIAVFLAGSLLSGAAQSMLQLILFRGVQGLGGGGIMAMAMAIIGDIVSPRERGRYQGYTGAVFALSSVVGPLLGGLFTDELTWRWVFYINLPLGVLALIVTSAVLKLPYRRLEHRIDYLGSVLMVSGVSCLLLVSSWGGTEYAWTSRIILGLTAAGVVLLALFIWQETRAEEPLLPLRLFRDRIFSVSSTIGLIVGATMFGAIAFLPIYLQVVKGDSATVSGLRLVPLMLGLVGSSVLSGILITRTGRYRVYPIAGMAIVIAGMMLMTRLSEHTSMTEVSAYMFVLGVGVGMVMQVIVLAVQNSADYKDLGTATAGVNFFRSMGSAFGVAIFGSVLTNRLDVELPRLLPAGSELHAGQVLGSTPAQLRAMPPAVHEAAVHAFSLSLHTMFLLVVPIAIVGFALTWLLREIPLRETVHVGTDRAAGEPADESPGEVAATPTEEPARRTVAPEPL
jgi:EmrB/QacA subfamily drug resistance transporter